MTKKMGYKPRPSRTAFARICIVAIGHWETINGHGGTIRPRQCKKMLEAEEIAMFGQTA